MNKAFTKEPSDDHDEPYEEPAPLPAGQKNYMTPVGLEALRTELHTLLRIERPKIVDIVAWAAGNGDRSENGDYIYGKKRLREIDRRVRYLTKQIDSAVVVDPANQQALKQVFFGATVEYAHEDDTRQTVTLVGVDEADLTTGKISWLSPVARALQKKTVGDEAVIHTPVGPQTIEVISITYRVPKTDV